MICISRGITHDQLAEIYSDPRMAIVGHDHRPCAPVDHPTAIYLSVHVDNTFCGAFLIIRASMVEMDIHALLLKCATKQSRNIGREVLKYIFDNWPDILRITGYVISGNYSALNYCLKVGMQFEGTRRHACIQNGVLKDVNITGITRADHSTQYTATKNQKT